MPKSVHNRGDRRKLNYLKTENRIKKRPWLDKLNHISQKMIVNRRCSCWACQDADRQKIGNVETATPIQERRLRDEYEMEDAILELEEDKKEKEFLAHDYYDTNLSELKEKEWREQGYLTEDKI